MTKTSPPSYAAILRFKKYCIKKELPVCMIQDSLRAAFKRRGFHWFSSNLSWYV